LISPEDKAFIAAFCKDIRKLRTIEVPVDLTIRDKLRLIPIIGLMKKYKSPVAEILSEIKNPIL